MTILNAVNKELPVLAKKLLERYGTDKNQKEFVSELAYWALEHIEEYRHKPMPTPPQEVILYAQKKLKDKSYKVAENFWFQPHVVAWRVQESKIAGENLSNYDWLVYIKDNLKTESDKAKVEGLLTQFDKEFLWGKDLLRKIVFTHSDPVRRDIDG